MDQEEKYRLAVETLQRIASFGHVPDCNSGAPVHECCCNEKEEKDLAQDCLRALGED